MFGWEERIRLPCSVCTMGNSSVSRCRRILVTSVRWWRTLRAIFGSALRGVCCSESRAARWWMKRPRRRLPTARFDVCQPHLRAVFGSVTPEEALGESKTDALLGSSPTHAWFDGYISQILDEGRGSLWFGSDHGIFKVRLSELNAVAEGRTSRVQSIHYGRGEGFPNLQAELGVVPTSMRSKDGLLWLPMRSALAVVNPEKLRENSEPPPVLIKEVVIDEQIVARYDGVLPPKNARSLQTPN